jgi:hypothetical protein
LTNAKKKYLQKLAILNGQNHQGMSWSFSKNPANIENGFIIKEIYRIARSALPPMMDSSMPQLSPTQCATKLFLSKKKLPDHDENCQIFPRMKIHIANKKHCKSLEQIESQVYWQIHEKRDQKTCFHFVESCL